MKKIILLILLVNTILIKGQIFTDQSSAFGLDHVCNSPYLMGGGVAVFDYDLDGDEDLYLTSGFDRDHLYENDGTGHFTEVGIAHGLAFTDQFFSFGVLCGDIDNDGDKDLFVTTFIGEDSITEEPIFYNNKLLLNDGGQFIDISIASGITDSLMSSSATFIDINLDGYLDIYVVNYLEEENPLLDSANNLIGYTSTCLSNHFYLNNQDNTFTESADLFGLDNDGCGLAVGATDFDNDQNIDIYLANDFGYWLEPNVLFENSNPGSTLTNTGSSLGADIGMFSMGIASGDFDEDLDLDYYITNIGPNVLLENDINVGFTDVASSTNVINDSVSGFLTTGWGTEFLDVNNDTYLDLLVANGHIPMPPNFNETSVADPNKLFVNDGLGSFDDLSVINGVADSSMSHGLAYGDFNDDGFLDYVTVNVDTNITGSDKSKLYMNSAISGNWIKIKLQGVASNRDGYGAHIILYADGRAFLRESDGGSSHASHSSSILHFGLGTINQIDSIEVYWPSKLVERLHVLPINETILVVEGTGIVNVNEIGDFSMSIFPNPAKDFINIRMDRALTSDANIVITDCFGKEVYRKQYDKYLFNEGVMIPLSNISSGFYAISITSNSNKIVKTFILE